LVEFGSWGDAIEGDEDEVLGVDLVDDEYHIVVDFLIDLLDGEGVEFVF
jgi:hypothetical protein